MSYSCWNTLKPSSLLSVRSVVKSSCGAWSILGRELLSNHLHENPFSAPAVELAIENLLPRTKIELSIRDRHDDFSAHNSAFKVGVRIVFAGVVMTILPVGGLRGQLLEPTFIVRVQTAFVVVDKDTCSDVHGIDQAKTFTNFTLSQAFYDIFGDVDELPAPWNVKPKLLPI
jgi:hypothetical protein